MELKTIIYIIAAIIYLYSRSKKKDKNPTGQTQPEEQGDVEVFDWEETIRKFTGGQEDKVDNQPATVVTDAPVKKRTQEEFSYDSKKTDVKDYDEEVISRRALKDWDAELLKRKETRNIEEEALKRNKAVSLEQQKTVTRHVPLVAPIEESEEVYAHVQLSFETNDLRKGFIYGEIFQPKHF